MLKIPAKKRPGYITAFQYGSKRCVPVLMNEVSSVCIETILSRKELHTLEASSAADLSDSVARTGAIKSLSQKFFCLWFISAMLPKSIDGFGITSPTVLTRIFI